MNYEEGIKRYRNDPKFKRLVDVLMSVVYDNTLSIYEVQQAASFAMSMFAIRHGTSRLTKPIWKDEWNDRDVIEED